MPSFSIGQGRNIHELAWDCVTLSAEEKYDGIFALLTNYTKEQVYTNQLVTKYRRNPRRQRGGL